jgi:hypothetical protein
MIASRKTFATIDAAAIESTNASPFGYALCGTTEAGDLPSVHEDEPRDDRRERGERLPLRLHRRLVDVHAVDLVRLDDPDPDGDRARADLDVEPLALRGGELLRVGHLRDRRLGRQDDGRRHDRTCERAHSDFVDAGDVLDADPPQQSLEMRTRTGLAASLPSRPSADSYRFAREQRPQAPARAPLVPTIHAVVPPEPDRLASRAGIRDPEHERRRAAVEEPRAQTEPPELPPIGPRCTARG